MAIYHKSINNSFKATFTKKIILICESFSYQNKDPGHFMSFWNSVSVTAYKDYETVESKLTRQAGG